MARAIAQLKECTYNQSYICSICVRDKDRYILADSTTKKEAKK